MFLTGLVPGTNEKANICHEMLKLKSIAEISLSMIENETKLDRTRLETCSAGKRSRHKLTSCVKVISTLQFKVS